MVFSSPTFIFLFLPIVLCVYYLLPKRFRWLRNGWLLCTSLFFYAWGEPLFVFVMLLSIAINYALALFLPPKGEALGKRRALVTLACVFNVGMLFVFKYLNLISDTFGWGLEAIRLPIGISFFTFQIFSYVIDVYRDDSLKQRNPLYVALYISFFPQLIAGPIVRYQDIAEQIQKRQESPEQFVRGLPRFITGFVKKVVLADGLARIADAVFALSEAGGAPTMGIAWLGLLACGMQIYFDFSGYSDMAIGMGRFFGFELLENFQYPYIARSVREFWRRWHLSLSTWFKDYLYIPLGGSRKGKARTYLNLLIVFALTGLWHGASWNYLLWGLYHGLFLVLERIFPKRRGERGIFASALGWLYTMLVVFIGTVFFRLRVLSQAFGYIGALFGLSGDRLIAQQAVFPLLDTRMIVLLLFGITACTPLWGRLIAWLLRGIGALRNPLPGSHQAILPEPIGAPSNRALRALGWGALFAAFVFALLTLSTASFSPFIYFQF